jgi:hypothetical protein
MAPHGAVLHAPNSSNFSCSFLLFGFSSRFLNIFLSFNGYFLFTTATWSSVKVKILGISKQKQFLGKKNSNPTHFHKDSNLWGPKPKPNSKIFRIWYTGTKNYFLKPQAMLKLRKSSHSTPWWGEYDPSTQKSYFNIFGCIFHSSVLSISIF